ncbi:hypothetical protein [Methylobacter tundripaludum]|uniref:Uncharacterized protein n=1 Tax=Methylobacter tundripaludum (strain ATCC BAA-1195 / DSM 17260 / SV96) TaxID=697282 RepID=G3IV65_METTV|nr:hypothetical protein [Methylobacter tundripaludum]EGW21678.1 hypothetical protein Mettu_0452 [Methylobacter tundripaludum SV96]
MWDLIDKLATIIGLIAAAIAAWNALKLRKETEQRWQKENEQIYVILRSPSQKIRLPVEIKRRDFTRSELLGYIGMLPLIEGKTRFNLNFTSTAEFSQQLEIIRQAGVEFIISCDESELDQFNYAKQPVAA